MQKHFFRELCLERLPQILNDIRNRNVYIWGAGKGGCVVEEVLSALGVTVSGFVDKNSDAIKKYLNYPVKNFTDVSPEKDYLVISLMSHDDSIYEQLAMDEKWKESRKSWFYPFEEGGCCEEDILYKGCRIGRYTYGYETFLEAFPNAKSIGRFCSINCTARLWPNHDMASVTTHPFIQFPYGITFANRDDIYLKLSLNIKNKTMFQQICAVNQEVTIGNDVWIGANAIILPGVMIGNGAVIGAGAVVTRDVEPYAVAAGVPARRIRYRFPEKIRKKLLEIKWWDWELEKIEEHMELFYDPEKFLRVFWDRRGEGQGGRQDRS